MDVIKTYYDTLVKKANTNIQKHFIYKPENFEKFQAAFEKRRDYVLNTYMQDSVKHLDRHKLSSIVMIELILNDIVVSENPIVNGSNVNIAPYLFATQAGFQLLLYWLNKDLKEKKQPRVTVWTEPTLLSCPDNNYFAVFARNLYYISVRNNGDYCTGYNELELAEKLYLFEYITLISNNIDPITLVSFHPERG